MFTRSRLALLASAILAADGALAANHRHAQRHKMHMNKNIVTVPGTTTTVTDLTWVTVTVDPDASLSNFDASVLVAAASTTTSSSVSTSSSPSSVYVASTTLLTVNAAPAVATPSADANAAVDSVSPTTAADNVVSEVASAADSVVAEVTSAAAAMASSVTSASSSKRGAAYNDASLVSKLLGTGSKIGWAYNWGSASDDLDSDLEFVPMLWGQKDVSSWPTNAQAAIDAGAKYLLGPNEPDNAGQANMDPATAATFHTAYMQPFAGKAKLTAPAVTNSNVAGTSLDWLAQFIESCSDCTFDVCPVHWYNTIEAGPEDLYAFLTKAHAVCGSSRTVWLTEFAPNVGSPSDADISAFLETVQNTLDNDSTYSFVERYSYFYVSEGILVTNGAASTYGKTYAFS